ncbi:DHDPS [Nesidiocoris tenuis]|uniref:N-acetylneuraminate lyase n=1 Tax=Nesidiocoris tenuis TaxID=355587 RepID=A0ABN7B2I8_9HEMI|nr:DHDPS [Nesidiocoris tenuis]
MVKQYKYRGMLAPVFTPFDENHRLRLDIVPKYAAFLKERGINAILVGGTTGEGVSMTVAERKSYAEAWKNAVKITGQSLMVMVGGASLADVKDMAAHAESIGADSLLCLADLFFRPQNVDQLVDYFIHVSEAAPRTPLLYYHIPSFTGINLDMEAFLIEGRKRIPTFGGIKFTHTDMEMGSRCMKAAGNDLAVFLGADQIFSGAAVLGFDSAIATTLNIWPKMLLDIQDLISRNEIERAKAVQDDLALKIKNISKHGNWVSTMKPMMKIVTGLDMGPPRPPLVPLSQQQILQIQKETKLTY